MRRTIGTLALALVVGLFGLLLGAEPGRAQGACVQSPGTNKYTCSHADWTHMPFGGASGLDITVVDGARIGSLWGFASSEILVEEGAEASYSGGPAIWSTGPGGAQLSNNTVTNRGKVAGITLYGNGNKIDNHGTISNPGVYISGTTSELTNVEGGLITSSTAVRANNVRSITNQAGGTIQGTARAIEILGSSTDQSTVITNHGTIRHTSGGVAIYRAPTQSRNASVWNHNAIVGSIRLLGDRPGWVINKEGAEIDGYVQLGNAGDLLKNETGATIRGNVLLGDGVGDELKNEGTIEGTVTSGTGSSEITNTGYIGRMSLGAGADDVTNKADATVDGNLGLGGGADELKNYGRIEGAVTAGTGTSEITNENFIASIALGAGDDEVTNEGAGTIAGDVGLGDGEDELTNEGRIEGTVTAGTGTSEITNENFIASIALGAGDDTVNNKADGTINRDVGLGGGENTLTNAGTIGGDVTSADGTDTVTNTATISGRVNLGGGVVGTDTNTINNSGTIGQGVTGGNIQNFITNEDGGQISGGISLGSADDEVTNEAGATIRGNVALGAGDDLLKNKAGATIAGNVGLGDGEDTLNNEGRIEGTVAADAGTATITNDNFIESVRLGDGHDTVKNFGSIASNVNLGNGDNTLTSSGDIGGNVITGTGFDEVDIEGTLQGSVSGGSGVDHVTVGSDAQVLGNVLLGDGDDKLILQNWDGSQILGAMDGGDGDDRLILEGGEGTLLTSGFRNFENVTVRKEGEWTISGAIPTSGGFLTSTLAGLWLEGDGNTVTYATGGEIAVEADEGTGVFVEGDDNAFANEGLIDVDGERATGIRVHGDENILVNTASGSVIATTESDTVTGVGFTGSDNEFTNDGFIDVSETRARGVSAFGGGNFLANSADGSIVADGDGATGVVVAGADNTLANEGRIEANGDRGMGVGVSGAGNNVANAAAGTIAAAGDEAMGVLVDGSDNGVENAGAIEVEGKDVVGVHIQGADNTFDNAGTVEARGDGMVTGVQVVSTDKDADANVITNTGTIRAESDSDEARGIVTTGDGKTQIHNELGALIEADIAIHAGGEGEYGITNDGTIRGDIVLGDGDHVVQNDGDIFGDIRLGDGNHDITNDGYLSGDIDLSKSEGNHNVELVGGSLWDPGLIQLGKGNDELTYSTVANDMTDQHTLDGGEGDDTLILVDDGYLNLYNVRNFETLELQDAGTWQFHRDVSFRDAITADAGHLILGNADEGGIEFGTGGLTIGSDARLSGTGTVIGDVTIHGTIAPGHSFGTFDVNGNYTQAAGSTYEAEMAIDGRRDLIDATGTATIDGDTLLDITAEYGYYDPTDRWNVLKADGGVTGTYGSAEWDIDLLFLGPEATTEGDNVYIDLVHAGPSFESVAGTPNQKAVAAALDAAEAAEVGDEVVNLVLPALHEEDARQAYDSLHGEIYAQHRWATLSSTQDFVDAANRGVNANGDTRSVWATAFKGMGTVKSQGKYMEAKHDHFGLALGWTAWAQDEWGVGLLGGFGSGNVSLADAASAGTASGYKFGAYAQYDNGFLGMTAQVVAGQDTFSVQRDMELLGNPLDDRAAEAEYDSSNMAVSLAGSLNYKVGDYDVQPTLGLNWFSVSRDKFTEKGAGGANLVVEADEFSIAQGALGVTINAPVAEGETYAPQFRVAYVTNFGEFESDFKAAFAAAEDVPFTIGGQTPGDSGFVAGGSIVGETGMEGLTYELSYDGKFLGSATVHTFGGMLGYSF